MAFLNIHLPSLFLIIYNKESYVLTQAKQYAVTVHHPQSYFYG